MPRIDPARIQAARSVSLTDALDRLGLSWQFDSTYRPRRNPDTRLVLVGDRHEITITNHLFILRARGCRGVVASGGGAIDLVMALTGATFRGAVRQLIRDASDGDQVAVLQPAVPLTDAVD